MRNDIDFAPLYRSSIGFDRVLNLLSNPQRLNTVDSAPSYDILKLDENGYRLQLAVPGYKLAELDITQDRNVLIVKGERSESESGEYLHRGISGRSFERRFELADHVRVEEASLSDGILSVQLVREVPEAAKPRKIAIGQNLGQATPLQIDSDQPVDHQEAA